MSADQSRQVNGPPSLKTKNHDVVSIDGDYQYRAITQGPAIQRFWHQTKLLAISTLLPPAPGDRILDVGCGSGVVSSYLARSGARVIGIDSNPRAIDFAAGHFAGGNLEFVRGWLDASLPMSGKVDKIYCLEVIEHVYRDQALKMLDSFRQALEPEGQLFVTTPNYRSLWPLIEWAMDRSGRFPVMEEEQHVERYHGKKLAALCSESGFQIDRLATVCLLSPWLAPLSRRLAERLFRLEVQLPVRLGSILVAVLRMRSTNGS